MVRHGISSISFHFRNEMLLNFGSSPSAAPLTIPARPGVDLNLGTPPVPVVPQRMPMEGNSHQKLVLQTPYGTFYREEVSGFYGYLPDQPRQRCHTLDRETMSRPSRSLHVIDEGNRRRYTLDKEYISKMVNKLSHKLEKRAVVNDDYNPPSVSSSVCSSPVPDDQYNRLGMGSTPDSSGCSSRTSPVPGKDRYSPGSPNPRSRSGSMAEKDYEIRRRCYSFHLNSEGRAARNLHPTALPMESERLLLDGIQPPYSADTRRGSVGASYGLHRHEKALLIERGGAQYLQTPEAFYRGIGKRPAKAGPDDAQKVRNWVTFKGFLRKQKLLAHMIIQKQWCHLLRVANCVTFYAIIAMCFVQIGLCSEIINKVSRSEKNVSIRQQKIYTCKKHSSSSLQLMKCKEIEGKYFVFMIVMK